MNEINVALTDNEIDVLIELMEEWNASFDSRLLNKLLDARERINNV